MNRVAGAKAFAVIGAGLAGLTAAHRLQQAGLAVTLFEKSRAAGGRMATRRIDGCAFDHGAQYVTAHGPAFTALLQQWQAAALLQPWDLPGLSAAFVGVPAMTAPARALAKGLTLHSGQAVKAIERRGAGWYLSSGDGRLAQPADGFAGLLLAMPAPQARALLSLLPRGAAPKLAAIAAAAYAPCWALMAAFARKLPGKLRLGKIDDEVIGWVALNSAKPGRDSAAACYVAHATPQWSRRHLELDADLVRDLLLLHLGRLAGAAAEPVLAQAHRWRYALVEQSAGSDCLWDPELMLGACGDWCIGPRVEAAFDSGTALAAAVLTDGPVTVS